jgi:hypothetical protein
MTWLIVIICEILLILFGVVIVLLSAELSPQIHPVVKPQQPPLALDNPPIIGDNDYVDD